MTTASAPRPVICATRSRRCSRWTGLRRVHGSPTTGFGSRSRGDTTCVGGAHYGADHRTRRYWKRHGITTRGRHDGLRMAPDDLAAAGTGVAPRAAHARRLLCCASAMVVLTVSQRKTRFGVGVAQAAVQMPQIPVEPVFTVPSRRCSQPGKACRPGGRGSVGPIAAASSPFGPTALRCRHSQVGKHSR